MTLIVGIDTGTHTGVTVWNVEEQRIERCGSMAIHEALDLVREMRPALVRVEDARLRKWIPPKAGREVLQGVGAVKRDAAIWEAALTDWEIPFEMVAPAHNATKRSAAEFRRITSWTCRTNEHARDSAGLVIGFTRRNLNAVRGAV